MLPSLVSECYTLCNAFILTIIHVRLKNCKKCNILMIMVCNVYNQKRIYFNDNHFFKEQTAQTISLPFTYGGHFKEPHIDSTI